MILFTMLTVAIVLNTVRTKTHTFANCLLITAQNYVSTESVESIASIGIARNGGDFYHAFACTSIAQKYSTAFSADTRQRSRALKAVRTNYINFRTVFS